MEGVSASSWRRKKGYERLDGSGRRRKIPVVELGALGSSQKRRFSWKVKIKPKLRFFHLCSPKKFLTRLRDGYVNMMLGFANSRVFTNGFGYNGNETIDNGLRRAPVKEYDERLLIEIYKALMAQGQLVSRDAFKPADGIVCRS
ncbi:hypothetical protein IFM89_005634 [Coptis chinensis]|uniref:Uncharacterized protein n=1 Tax=Coptis chinensis TaxID=261450 RepID=A0A835HU15_9MAGN|nr:hypothetical protein IFM89_005634 [Coptis chinensis]